MARTNTTTSDNSSSNTSTDTDTMTTDTMTPTFTNTNNGPGPSEHCSRYGRRQCPRPGAPVSASVPQASETFMQSSRRCATTSEMAAEGVSPPGPTLATGRSSARTRNTTSASELTTKHARVVCSVWGGPGDALTSVARKCGSEPSFSRGTCSRTAVKGSEKAVDGQRMAECRARRRWHRQSKCSETRRKMLTGTHHVRRHQPA